MESQDARAGAPEYNQCVNFFPSIFPSRRPRSSGRIYLDYASAPPVCDAALRAMREGEILVGNPGAIHEEGVRANAALMSARERIAKMLAIKSREIVFTSGLTDSNNLAIIGAARAIESQRRSLAGTHWLVSAIEHASVLECFSEIERLGGTISHIEPDAHGIISSDAIARALRPESVFVSVAWANNEIGTIQPLSHIAEAIAAHEKSHGTTILLHADAGQAPLYEASVFESLGIDLLSLGGNKLYGPHGVGALALSNRAHLVRVIQGGPQERALRPGTENVALALGMAAAYEAVASKRTGESKRVRQLRDELHHAIIAAIPQTIVNGDLRRALPHMLNISIPGINSEYVVLALDRADIALSTKSACREGEERRSHVVEALGGSRDVSSEERAQTTLRFSLGAETRSEDVERTARELARIINKPTARRAETRR
jgi:cysteine desulfurase